MKLPADVSANDFPKPAFIGSMDILVAFLGSKFARLPFLSHLLEAFFDFREFMGGENAVVVISACKCNAAIDIFTPEARIVREGPIILNEEGVLAT